MHLKGGVKMGQFYQKNCQKFPPSSACGFQLSKSNKASPRGILRANLKGEEEVGLRRADAPSYRADASHPP